MVILLRLVRLAAAASADSLILKRVKAAAVNCGAKFYLTKQRGAYGYTHTV